MWFHEEPVETLIEVTPTWVTIALLFLGYLGSVYFVAPAVATAYVRGTSWNTATWPGIVLGGYGLFVTLKSGLYVERPALGPPFPAETLPFVLRPVYHLAVQFETGAFPSGHAVIVTVLWGLFVVDLEVRTVWERLAVALGVVVLVGYSRIVLGLHYVGDVVGGVALGLLLLAVMLVVRRRAAKPANATLLVALVPVLAGFPAGTPFEAGALLGVLVGVYLLNEYTGLVSPARLTGDDVEEPSRKVATGGRPEVE